MATNIIRLNVGGVNFDTTIQTLSSCGFFSAAFIMMTQYGIAPALMDVSGRYFIDRDGNLFSIILTWLRVGKIFVANPTPQLLAALEDEADFYDLQSLRHYIEQERAKGIWRAEEAWVRQKSPTPTPIHGMVERSEMRLEPALFTTPIDF